LSRGEYGGEDGLFAVDSYGKKYLTKF